MEKKTQAVVITEVLQSAMKPMSAVEVYGQIVQKRIFAFNTKDHPLGIVRKCHLKCHLGSVRVDKYRAGLRS